MTVAVSTAHADALEVLSAWRAPTLTQKRLREQYVAHLEAHPDALHRSCRPDHLTASTLVLSPEGAEVLLTLHAKAGQWFQLGGHVEPGDLTLAGAALREAVEESGLCGLSLDPDPVHLDLHEVPFCGGGDQPTRHLDVRFVAVADPSSAVGASEESTDVRWWPGDALPTDEPSLHELVALARAGISGR